MDKKRTTVLEATMHEYMTSMYGGTFPSDGSCPSMMRAKFPVSMTVASGATKWSMPPAAVLGRARGVRVVDVRRGARLGSERAHGTINLSETGGTVLRYLWSREECFAP